MDSNQHSSAFWNKIITLHTCQYNNKICTELWQQHHSNYKEPNKILELLIHWYLLIRLICYVGFNLSRFCWRKSPSNTSPLFIILSILTSTAPCFWLATLSLCVLPKVLSSDKPANTSTVPVHCNVLRGCRKISTEPRIVKNLRVVVKMLHVSGPKYVTVRKIKFCNIIYNESLYFVNFTSN